MIARTLIAFGALALVGALPASAAVAPAKDAAVSRPAAGLVLARHGADDGANHDRNDDKGGKKHGAGHASAADGSIVLARHGADDGANHDQGDDKGGKKRRGRGKDD